MKVSEQTSETSQLSEKWFHHLDPNMLNIVVGIAKQPFPELRLSSHSVLKTLSALPWGQKKMNEFPGFNEYLLDRSTEKTKEGKESKFQIVKSLAESPTTLNIFGHGKFFQNFHSVICHTISSSVIIKNAGILFIDILRICTNFTISITFELGT